MIIKTGTDLAAACLHVARNFTTLYVMGCFGAPMTESNKELLLSSGDYFRLNHPEATAETLAFIELLKANAGQIAAVLAGHLHYHNESEIAPGLPQFVTSQGVLGNINRYEIGE